MDILSVIESKYHSLSTKKKQLAKYILTHWELAAFMSAWKLADEVGVSESLVVRFAQDIGLAGYPELQQKTQALVRRKLPLLERFDRSLSKDAHDPLGLVCSNSLSNIEVTFKHLPEGLLDDVASRIVATPTVVSLGLGNSATMANLLALNLNRLLGKVWYWDLGAGDFFDRVLGLDEDVLGIIFSFPPYYRHVVEAARLMCEQDIDIVAITDSSVSPLAEYSSSLILVETAGVSYAESHVATTAVIDAIVSCVAEKGKEDRRDYFTRRVSVHNELQWWVEP